MFCPKCGTQAIDGTKFCRGCGMDLEPVAAVLSGKLALSKSKKSAKKHEDDENSTDPDKLWNVFFTNSLAGLAFIAIALFLMLTNTIGGSVWGFWLLIPGAGSLGSGIASYFKAKRIERRNSNQNFAQDHGSRAAQPTQQFAATAPPNNLPPARPTLFDEFGGRKTGELAAPPASITENTTRHLQTFDENESLNLPGQK